MGDQVAVVVVPTVASKFLARWQGSFDIVAKVEELNYRVYDQGKKKPYQIYHMHFFKSWNEKELVFTLTSSRLKSQVGVDNVRVASTLSKSPNQEKEEIFGKDLRDCTII